MKEKLFIWFMTTTRWRAGVPQFFYNAELSDLENPTNSDWKYMKNIPSQMLLTYKNKENVRFDWVSYRNRIMVVSEDFLSFLSAYWEENRYVVSPCLVQNSKGVSCSDKSYFVLFLLEVDNSSFIVEEEGKKRMAGNRFEYLYPNITIKEQKKGVFYYDRIAYKQGLLFTEETKDIVLSSFYKPEIYLIEDFPTAYNNMNKKEEFLPKCIMK
ncbi:hypothetical protein [uncultured Capnocytophaga sp.]|uniref:Imm43 family immunity protein n=1 Tax=uncultured Capnocytophaga sp. TaxID=159273 RepID=UPI002631E8BB|nr:hypothetical protein [uncultured Capnocytophaga sp.]